MTPIRWSDEDRYLGPLTFAPNRFSKTIGVQVSSGDGDEYPRCRLMLQLFWFTIILALPQWVLRPEAKKVYPGSWDEATIARLGRNWYWAYSERAFGFAYSNGFLQIFKGRRTMDSSTDQSKGWFVPWRHWRHVRFSLFGLTGQHVWSQYKRPGVFLGSRYTEQRAAEEACPSVTFRFLDFDGEEISVRTHIEERQWKRGEGRFKWLSLFVPDKVERSLDLRFSSEVGGSRPDRKGSWKGGTLGHSIGMLPGELHEAAFKRYCGANNLTFIEGSGVPDPGTPGHYLAERYGIAEKPTGWNEAVKGFFFRGPERREPSDDFRSAFHERASDKIMAGLNDAVRHASGDKTAGRVHRIAR